MLAMNIMYASFQADRSLEGSWLALLQCQGNPPQAHKHEMGEMWRLDLSGCLLPRRLSFMSFISSFDPKVTSFPTKKAVNKMMTAELMNYWL